VTRYYIEPDGDHEPSVWAEGLDPDLPLALVRRCDVSAETWDLITAGIDCLNTPREAS
jgi:hypothetical protein